MRYAFVAKHRQQFTVRAMCRCLRIRPRGFYDWLKNPLSTRAREDVRQTELLSKAWQESGRVYGYRKLHDDLLDQGETSCANRIARLARMAGIKAQIGYNRRPGSYGGKPSDVVDNTLARQFDVDAPDRAWVTDITYIRTQEGFAYLAVVIDLFSRRVIGWSLQSRQTTDVVLQALLMAVWRRKPKSRVLVHSDQDSQFTSMDWAAFLKHHNLEHSMSRRGNCHDNAVAESFFNLLKRERIRRRTYRTREEARKDVSTTSRCSTTPSVSTSGTGCCHPSSSNGSRKCNTRASTKLGAIQTIRTLNQRIASSLARFSICRRLSEGSGFDRLLQTAGSMAERNGESVPRTVFPASAPVWPCAAKGAIRQHYRTS